MTVNERSKAVANFVQVALQYLQQADNGPKEISFLPLYYALLNLSKAYIAIGPYGHELDQNRWHGASYDIGKNAGSLSDDFISLDNTGVIPLFYQTLTGESVVKPANKKLDVKVRDFYSRIYGLTLEYKMTTKRESELINFGVTTQVEKQKERIVATPLNDWDHEQVNEVGVSKLQAFVGFTKVGPGATLAGKWCDRDDTVSLRKCLRPAMLYGFFSPDRTVYQSVPWSNEQLLFPEEIPLICALFHMSNVVRYNPDAFKKLTDSKGWPLLLALRTNGIYRFLLAFWSYVNQRSFYITVY